MIAMLNTKGFQMRCGIAIAMNGLFILVNLLLMAQAHSWQGLDNLIGVPLYIGAFTLQIIVSLFGLDAAFDRELRCWRPPHWPLGVISTLGLVSGMASLIAIFHGR